MYIGRKIRNIRKWTRSTPELKKARKPLNFHRRNEQPKLYRLLTSCYPIEPRISMTSKRSEMYTQPYIPRVLWRWYQRPASLVDPRHLQLTLICSGIIISWMSSGKRRHRWYPLVWKIWVPLSPVSSWHFNPSFFPSLSPQSLYFSCTNAFIGAT